jgi:hypothetical protein
VAKRRQQRRREKERRHATEPATLLGADDGRLAGRVEPLAYTRDQAAQALGVSLATLDRRVVPAIATVKTEWGARLIPVGELNATSPSDKRNRALGLGAQRAPAANRHSRLR